jgi:hypothetical protein
LAKTLLHLLVATVLWFILGAVDVGVPWRIGAIVLGAVAVHLFWEHFVFKPFLYLGAMPFLNDDPLMEAARAKAKETLPLFLETLFPEHREDSTIAFRFTTSSGQIENLWGDLLEVNGNSLKIYLRTPPVNHDQPLDRNHEVSLDDVVDWQVEYRDGTLRGGYTNRALFKIFERQEGYMHPQFLPQIARFRDVEGGVEA